MADFTKSNTALESMIAVTQGGTKPGVKFMTFEIVRNPFYNHRQKHCNSALEAKSTQHTLFGFKEADSVGAQMVGGRAFHLWPFRPSFADGNSMKS